MFLNLSEFNDVGFFDENFFFFLEEIDLCTRLLKQNKKIYYCPRVPVYHEGGHSHESSFNYCNNFIARMRINGEGKCYDEIKESEKGLKHGKNTKKTGARLRLRSTEIFCAIGKVHY